MAEHLGFALFPQRVGAAVLGILGILGTLLAGLGLYGVMSYIVARRTPEIGIRLALGARPVDVRLLVVRRAMKLAGAGIALGIGGAFAATRLLTGFLVEVSPTDPAVLALVAGFFGAVALFASWHPAHRAARLDPVEALRSE
jgi:ABC-type antimicrobial peptide transport system permease subunit